MLTAGYLGPCLPLNVWEIAQAGSISLTFNNITPARTTHLRFAAALVETSCGESTL
jgi:hypothetical protein